MSGNPFRRPQANKVVENADPREGGITGRMPLPSQLTKTNRVTVQTAPDSLEDIYKRTSLLKNGRDGPSALFGTPLFPADPPRIAIENDEESYRDGNDMTRRTASDSAHAVIENAGRSWMDSSMPALTTASNGIKAPYNPFARTLATSEAILQDQNKQEAQGDILRTRQDLESNEQRRMNVDTFKNILMTGSTAPPSFPETANDTTATRPPVRFLDSNSSSTGSAINSTSLPQRLSLFDQSFNIHPESPRSSFDDEHAYRSSDADSFENEDSSSLMGPLESRPQEVAPRAPPKPRPKGPQTVSFAEFDQSIPPDFQASGPVRSSPLVNAQLQGILRPSVSRSHSDLNKPLPPPPQQSGGEGVAPPSVPEKNAFVVPLATASAPELPLTRDSAVAYTIDDSASKKVPPPPPVTRRQGPGQTRPQNTLTTTPDSSMLPPLPTMERLPAATDRATENSSPKSAPPPPPTRRAAHPPSAATTGPGPATPDEFQPDFNSSSPAPVPPFRTTPGAPKAAMPPPPPRRHPSRSGSNFSNTRSNSPASSIRSENSRHASSSATAAAGSTNSVVLTNSSSAPMPLLPLPPLRSTSGGSTRNSSDFVWPGSGNGSDNQKLASSEVGAESSVMFQDGGLPRNLLADMTAFQAEIDALVARENGAKGAG